MRRHSMALSVILLAIEPLQARGAAHPAMYPNTQRYRETPGQKATGRAGNATLEARLLVSKDGSAVIEATTGVLDSSAIPPGTIAKLQLKQLNSDSDAVWTRNFLNATGGYVRYAIGEFRRATPFQAQANIRGIDASRTNVVTVTGTAKLRPDLAVTRLVLPDRALPGANIAVTALVAELNGDVGATGDCVLYVDGAEADRSAGMWVDAGDTVACVLNHRFETPGTHTVDVAVQGIAPTDDDATNDRRSGSIQVGLPAVPMQYQVLASNDHQNWSFHEDDYYRAASDAYFDQPDYSTTESYAGDHQLVSLHAWATEQALSFPISVDFRASTDGGLVSAYRLDGLTGSVTTYSDGGSFSAVSWYDSDTDSNEHLLVQIVKSADGYRYTDVQAWRNAGFVQFWGHTYCRAWLCGSPSDYAWSSATYDPMPMRPMGSTYTFDVTLNDASTALTTTATVTLVPYDNSSHTPYQCAPEIDLGTGYFARYCSELRTSQTGAWGTVTGP